MPDETVPDFWPNDVGESNLRTPAEIMKEAASYLGPKTEQLVKAEVLYVGASPDGRFIQDFVLRVPTLDDYKYQLFRVYYPITLYPATIVWHNTGSVVGTQEDFVSFLQQIIAAPDTIQAIRALIAQARPPVSS